MLEQWAASWVCKLAMACGSGNGPVNVNSNVTVYHVDSHPAITQMTVDQINSIGLDCNRRDLIVTVLEQQVGNQPVNPEQLDSDRRRLNASARSKIWQLRTYCP